MSNTQKLNIGSKNVKFSVMLEIGDDVYEEDIDSKLSIPNPETLSTKQLTNMMISMFVLLPVAKV